MKTLIALVLTVILLSACGNEKIFRGYVEVGTNPIKTYHKRLKGNEYYSITTVKVTLKDGSTIIANFPPNEGKFTGDYYLRDRSLNPEIKDKRIYVAGTCEGNETPVIRQASPYEIKEHFRRRRDGD